MRTSRSDLLRCPRCHHHPLDVEETASDDREIRQGALRCGACTGTFPIADGVAELLCDISHQAIEELESIDSWLPGVEKLTPLDDQWLIGLPNTFHKGDDTDIAVNLPRLLAIIEPQPGQRVLEVGAGTTWLANLLAQRGCEVTATDIVRRLYVGLDSADVLMLHSGTVYDRVLAEMNDVPYVDGAFDVVVANAVFHHSEDLPETFAEMHRVLRPGGRMVLLEPVVGPLNLAGKAYMTRLHDDGLGDEAYPVWAYTGAARKAGFACEVSIAPSVDHHLLHMRDDPEFSKNTSLKYRLARGAGGLTRVPAIGGLAKNAFERTALYLFGLTCIIVARRHGAPSQLA